MVAYVDDLNFVMGNESALVKTIETLLTFEKDMALNLSMPKTKEWSTDNAASARISTTYGFEVAKDLLALGGHWKIAPGPNPLCPKESLRMQEMSLRLTRVQHAPVSFLLKVDAASTACLSLMDYVNHPSPTPAKSLRSQVKRALDQKHAAPEILFNGFLAGSIDPYYRWIMAGFRLWYHAMQTIAREEHVRVIVRRRAGRLGIIAGEALKHDIEIFFQGFACDGAVIRTSQPWFLVRKVLLARLKSAEYQRVALKRPEIFGGLTGINAESSSQTPKVR